MAFAEDLSVFFNPLDFGVTAVVGGSSFQVILDMPGQQIGELGISTDYAITGKASDLGSLMRGNTLTVDGVSYKVREPFLLDDGRIIRITLTKL